MQKRKKRKKKKKEKKKKKKKKGGEEEGRHTEHLVEGESHEVWMHFREVQP